MYLVIYSLAWTLRSSRTDRISLSLNRYTDYNIAIRPRESERLKPAWGFYSCALSEREKGGRKHGGGREKLEATKAEGAQGSDYLLYLLSFPPWLRRLFWRGIAIALLCVSACICVCWGKDAWKSEKDLSGALEKWWLEI